MGVVRIDIYQQDRKYHNLSLSSDEDILEVLFIADIIKQDAKKGNHEAIVLKLDFEKLFLRNDVCKEYYKILNGYDETYLPNDRIKDHKKSIIELVAERLHMSKEECEDILHKSISEMVEENKEIWSDWANERFKGKVKVINTPSSLLKWDDESKFYQNDFNKKYIMSNHNYKEFDYPKDLQELVDAQKKNEKIIEELELLKKDKKITKEQKEQLKKRIRLDIALWEDIGILKNYYKIEIKKTNTKGKKEVVSYSEEYSDRDVELLNEENTDIVNNEWQLHKIKSIAEKVLTNKQLVIFNLYYVANMSQQQIAELLNETQGNISRDLQVSLKKIRKKL